MSLVGPYLLHEKDISHTAAFTVWLSGRLQVSQWSTAGVRSKSLTEGPSRLILSGENSRTAFCIIPNAVLLREATLTES